MDPPPSERTLARLRNAVPGAGWAAAILARQRDRTWWATKKSCYGPKFMSTIWQLQVLADLGLSRREERIANAVELWFDLHCAKDGGYDPWEGRHGRGHLCTTGNMARSLLRLGYRDDERVESAIAWLVGEQYPNGGWDCFGRRNATIDAWEGMSAFAEIPPRRRSAGVKKSINRGAEFFLRRRLLHEGPRFGPWYSLHYPWHYFYDVLVGLDFMTALGFGEDPRMGEALGHLESKRLPDGRWRVDRTNGNLVLEPAGKPSKMITFLALRVLKRAGRLAPVP